MATEKCCICGKVDQPKWMLQRGDKVYCDKQECINKIPKEFIIDLNTY